MVGGLYAVNDAVPEEAPIAAIIEPAAPVLEPHHLSSPGLYTRPDHPAPGLPGSAV